MAERRPRGRPATARDRKSGRITPSAFRGDLTAAQVRATLEHSTHADELVQRVSPAHLEWRNELARRTREWAAALRADARVLSRAWARVNGRSRTAPVALDEGSILDLAHVLAQREMARSAPRRAAQWRTPGARRRVSDDTLRAALADPRMRGARDVPEMARRAAEVLRVPLTRRQLRTRIARLQRPPGSNSPRK